MKWKRYPSYKDSGVEWLGEVPEHWTIIRLKHCVREKNKIEFQENCFLVELEHIQPWTGKVEPMQTEEASGKTFSHGDVLFNRLRPYLAKAFLATEDGVCSSELLVMQPILFRPRYLLFLLLTKGFIDTVDSSTYGAKMPRASWEFIKNIVVSLPYPEEQEQIAEFVDRETNRIDTLIAKKQHQLELLEEKRNALITHAVTKGLDPNVKMKDSGVEWLGEVPEHWKVMKLKRIASLRSGHSINSTDIDINGPYPVFGGNGIRGYSSEYTHEGDFVLIGRQGALCGCINYASGRFWASEHAVVVTPLTVISTLWLGELLRTMNLNRYSQTAAQPGLSVEFISNLSVPFPPLNEQLALERYLRNVLCQLNPLMSKIQQSIEILKQYRSALITAAVTGQIDVREEV
jgi:type I restriction enzyme S subunit